MRKFRPRFAIALPVLMVALDGGLQQVLSHVESENARYAAMNVWLAINWPAQLMFLLMRYSGDTFGRVFDWVFRNLLGEVLLACCWVAVGLAIDSLRTRKAGPIPSVSKPGTWTKWQVMFVVMCLAFETVPLYACFTQLRWAFTSPPGIFFSWPYLGTSFIAAALIYVGWCVALAGIAVKFSDTGSDLIQRLFRQHTELHWKPYALVLFATGIAFGIDAEMLFPAIALIVALLQLRYRSIAGWVFLLCWCIWYGGEALARSLDGVLDWKVNALYIAVGLAPAIALLIWNPGHRRVQELAS